MSCPLTLESGMLAPNLSDDLLDHWSPQIEWARKTILDGRGRGSSFLGWRDPAALTSGGVLGSVMQTAQRLRQDAEYLVVVGIGGSYLGARAGIEALAELDQKNRVLFAGQNISALYHSRLLEQLKGKRFALNVISKSGTTTEPAIAYRLLRQLLIDNVGAEDAARLTVVTTDPEKGALRSRSREEHLECFTIPANVGGRFSVLTPVGLLPMAFAGVDITDMVQGADDMARHFQSEASPRKNPILAYAAFRNALYQQGLGVEVLSFFEPALLSVAEWFKQLFGESEGKDGLGLLPTSLLMTTDLHSLGQYVQDGRRQLFETFLWVDQELDGLSVPGASDNKDGLGYLEGRSLASINQDAFRGTQLAHRDGGVPIMTLRLPSLDAHNFGALLYFFEAACAVSGTLLGVNPFDQPAVEAYKKNMFALLGKPGFEEHGQALRERLSQYTDA